MYAIISDGGRQFKVTEGQELQIDYRGEDIAVGTEIVFDRVLAAGEGESLRIGSPVLAGARVSATVQGEFKGEKLVIQKFRRRKNSKRKTGHRQIFTTVLIEKITA
ncbi:MAG: 50S ribosomal protein L21 [Pirellulales bacterium]|nr:50S ribosomal protein L21 [Pirellulales bacterium]